MDRALGISVKETMRSEVRIVMVTNGLLLFAVDFILQCERFLPRLMTFHIPAICSFVSLVWFLNRVEESYRRMVNPACQEVDASPSKEEVLKTVLQLIKNHCAW